MVKFWAWIIISEGKPPSFVSRLGTGCEKQKDLQKEQYSLEVSRFDDPVLLLSYSQAPVELSRRCKFPAGHVNMEV